nr:hypothetical protein B0A51_14718 [Rachicladosporium sp. CCFEE 5018]
MATAFLGYNKNTISNKTSEQFLSDPADLLRRLSELCNAIVASGLVSVFCYTQLADIESETNGLYTYDRQPKLEPEEVKTVIQRAKDTYYHSITPETVKTTIKRRGKLRETCYGFQLLQNGRVFRAMCATTGIYKTQNPGYVPSELNLNDCLTNAGGQLRWAKGEDLAVYLVAQAGDGVEGWGRNRANLGNVIWNEEGR